MPFIDIPERIRLNREEYSDTYDRMNWLFPEAADKALDRRKALLQEIFAPGQAGPGWLFDGTKLYTHSISPGCALCGQGDWSCLFINGICNASCFYCPSSQKEKGLPMTSSLTFDSPRDYADYVKAFNIKGVSFSGGEPLMTFERVLAYLKVLRSRFSDSLYIWMYTNGLLVTENKLKALKDNGLDEIRFDISADHYHLDALKKAVGLIPRVTVEIPAVPEDLETMKKVMPRLADLGVNHLNLHQIRCTAFNRERLIQRGYTFLHGPRVTVLETELTALELIRTTLEQDISLPVNYCSFTFRHQFQGAGARKRNAGLVKSGHEDATPTGHIRTLSIMGGPKDIQENLQNLLTRNIDNSLWKISKAGDQLFFNASLWPLMDFSRVSLKVSHSSTALKPAVSFRNPFKEIRINSNKKVIIERQTQLPGILVEKEQIQAFGNRFIRPEGPGEVPGDLSQKTALLPETENRALPFESALPGLYPYF
ncbi:radical SAM protein [Desulfospira joergensenii]|uniref:radical SAM protein n=1 Tax=Desulfospira joergensenii TaxID=53329 RepID=UPI000A067629|nr:radical SAM protein [Desulfospira joergensenii]